MNKCRISHVILAMAVVAIVASSLERVGAAETPAGVVQLFNGKDLDGFYTWLKDSKHKDPRQVFRVTDGMLHVTGDGLGGLLTNKEYRDYHSVLEFKWGTQVWGDRKERTKDSGLLIHSLGADGGHTGTWMPSIEVQIIEGGVGDFILVTGNDKQGQPVPLSLTCETARDRDGEVLWKDGGQRETHNLQNPRRVNWYGRDPDWKDVLGFRGKNDVESPSGQWTRIDTICEGGHIRVYVNGIKVNEAFDSYPTQGRLQLQTELAELFVRRWELWPVGQVPDFKVREKTSGDSSTDKIDKINKIKVPAGYSVELAAGPPLVKYPMMACFDDRGRLFVGENAGGKKGAAELEEQLPNSIRMLEDTDSDGQFDRSTVFADKMTFPMGGTWHEGALYVASPPNIWRLEDTDGDRVADKREVLVSHFGFSGNAASVHGCFLGPDGRLYWTDGGWGHEIKDKDGQILSKRDGSYIFSCWPNGSDVRIHCGGGMDNPVEIVFTDEGEMLGTVNILYSRPRSDCLVHWLYGGAYPHREHILNELKITGDVLGPVHDFGHVAISGLMQYRTNEPTDPCSGNLFAAYFNNGKVVRLEMERDGSTFRATQREFLSSTIHDFHTTDVLEDADGSLLIVNTGGWFYKGCPTSQLADRNTLGGIYRVRRTDQVTPDDPWGRTIDWHGLTDPQVAARLDDARFKVRQRAIAESAKRYDTIVPTLQQSLQRGNIRLRRNALWALTRIVGANPNNRPARALIRLALSDAEQTIRLSACRSIATNSDAAATGSLLKMVQGEQPSIRREAAKALGRIGDATAVPDLLAALGRTADRAEEHAIIYALIEINHPSATARGLTANSAAVQRGALVALDQMDSGRLTSTVVAPLLDADDPLSRKAALRVVCRHSDWAGDVVQLLTHWLGDNRILQQRSEVARGLMAKFIAEPPVASLVGQVLTESSLSAARALVLQSIADGQSLPLHKSWTASLLHELQSENQGQLELALAAVAAIETDQFNEILRQIGTDKSRPPLVRVAALEAASTEQKQLTSPLFELLVSMMNEGGTPAETGHAAQLIGMATLTKEQLTEIVPYLVYAAPMPLRNLIQPFQRNTDADVGKAFLAALEMSAGFTSLSPVELSDVIKGYPAELLPTANRLLDILKEQEEQKLATLDALIPQLKHGDATRGEAIFFSEKAACATCHRVADKGIRVGPDLTTIGSNRSGRDLLESIVFPSASIVRDYEPYAVLTDEGRVLTGLLTHETTDTLTLQQQTGAPVLIARDAIEEISASTVSIMPSGLEKVITQSELADVTAYLQSLKQPAARDSSR